MKRHLLLVTLLGFTLAPLNSCSSFYGDLVDNQVRSIESLNEILQNVHNKDTADAAADQLRYYGKTIAEVIGKIGKNGTPNILELWRLKNQLESDKTTSAATNLLIQYIRLSMANYYGSESLKNAFVEQINTFQQYIPK